MADSNTEAVQVVPQAAKFAAGDKVSFEVDGEQYDAVIRTVSPVGGQTAKYTVARSHNGVTGFKSEKYVDESRLTAVEGAAQEKTAKKAKKAPAVSAPVPEEPVTPPAPEEPKVPEVPETPVVEPAEPAPAESK